MRTDGACQWLLKEDAYQRWLGSDSVIWLYGGPGVGKSMLTTAVLDNLEESELLGLYYFVHGTNNDVENTKAVSILRSLVLQLWKIRKLLPMQQSLRAQDLVRSEWWKSSLDNATSFYQLWNLFLQLLNLTMSIWIVIDGLEECRCENKRKFVLEERYCYTKITGRSYPQV